MAAAGGGLPHDELIRAGRAALARGDWAGARSAFRAALARADTPEACHGLACAEEWAGDFDAAVRLYERAFAGYRARGETRLPALIAGRKLSFLHAAVFGNLAAAGGWLARARSLADEAGECPETGWVELAEALAAEDPDEIDTHAWAATGIARRAGDADLEFCALGYRGLGLVLRGRVAEGMRRVDEAAIAATMGEVRDHLVVGEIFCTMLLCCELTLDVRRAQQWITTAESAGRRSNDLWVSAVCRMYYGGIMTAAGRWQEAEDALSTSLRLYDDGMRAMRSGAAVRLADLRIRQGRLAEAAMLLADHESDPQAVLPLARLYRVRGEVDRAAAVLRRSLGSGGTTVLHAPVLALLVEAHAVGGRLDDAHAAQQQLRDLAAGCALPNVGALAAQSAGVLSRASGADALSHFESALSGFLQAGLPWEAARCRLLIARLLAGSTPDVAVAEARSALEVFRRLGARHEADEAATVLRTLGAHVHGVPAPRTSGPLTGREREVLVLLVEGLSNQQIADRLFLSKRTVEHHVGSIFAKLGVATRAEALAYAIRHGVRG
ncbi:helix-turn-helix transcriptional regulator [Blastococcus mobilis]|uniref:Transcriptional regulator, LuxR family n=1 Tax=Blastococcus mobilis TaxID=1938746 RepID=A0A238V781_9ACTN|nr:LuxR C-terminal-related transcriptional regulator [Blastococcus mobilis]SNR30260.1 transcriptional regulator, LuxR family [Blastococcus mobilis]